MDALRVWINDKPVGRLAKHSRGTTFVYDPGVSQADAVSLTMPVRVASYDVPSGMIPVFDTNIPEGHLLMKIRRVLAKDDRGRVDPLDILALTGGNQIGRIRILPEGVEPERREPVSTIDEILKAKTSSQLIDNLIERYALRSGVSGAMPKILAATAEDAGQRTTVPTRDWILKFDSDDFPGLSLNEYHCLAAARAAGNIVAETELSDDGRMLAVKRFDELGDQRMGFEDFASLNGKTAESKYEGSIETSLFKTARTFSGRNTRKNLEELYRQVVTSIVLRNGDAHLKNYGILYTDARDGPFELAPAYDMVTTRAFDELKHDLMALSLDGTKRWPGPKAVVQLGARAQLSQSHTSRIMTEIAHGVSVQAPLMLESMKARGMSELGVRIAVEWRDGLEDSLAATQAAKEIDDLLATFDASVDELENGPRMDEF